MNAIQNFAFEEHLVRVVQIGDQPWFAGKDVCAALDIKDHKQALGTLDDDERRGYTVPPPSSEVAVGGGEQTMIVVSMPGVFRLIFRSRKPEAERFKRWLAHDVLPEIAVTGSYRGNAVEPLLLSEEQLGITRLKVEFIREVRVTLGKAQARALWPIIGLPVPWQAAEQAPYRDDGAEALAHLLGRGLGGITVREALDDDPDGLLADFGIRPAAGGFFVSNTAAEVARAFAATRWAADWRQALLSVPGARRHGTVRFASHQAKAVWLPLT